MTAIRYFEDRLTTREAAVLQRVARGMSNRAIAQDLSISLKTVETHLTHIFAKLDVTTRTQAALWAARRDHR